MADVQTPREIAFEDIKKGDDIEARYVRDGVTCTRRGIAHGRGARAWYTEAGGLIASGYEGDWTHYLHSRPAPEEPKGLGAVVRARVAKSVWHGAIMVRTASHDFPWVDEEGNGWVWAELDPESVEVLSEGIEVPRGSEVES